MELHVDNEGVFPVYEKSINDHEQETINSISITHSSQSDWPTLAIIMYYIIAER